MLNKNANCYNIENKFKYSSVITTFSEHNTIFWTPKCQQWQTHKTKNGKLFFCKLFILLRKATLESKVAPTNSNTSKTFSKVELFCIFSQTFFGTKFRYQNKNKVNETIGYFVYQLLKKYCVYYVSERLKYCTQINKYWFNKKIPVWKYCTYIS